MGGGGGGAGGRIGVLCKGAHKFGGHYRSAGGWGEDTEFAVGFGLANEVVSGYGAAGTLYKEETARGPQYAEVKHADDDDLREVVAGHTFLKVDNENHLTPWFTMVQENLTETYHFDEVELLHYANVEFYHPNGADEVHITIDEFKGDQTGLVRVQDDQHLFVEYVEGEPGLTTAPVAFECHAESSIYFPNTVNLYGERSVFEGRIVNVIDLIVAKGAEADFASTTQTAKESRHTHTQKIKLVQPVGMLSCQSVEFLKRES